MTDLQFSPIPDYENLVIETETFLQKLNQQKMTVQNWSLLWKCTNQFAIRAVQLERKWRGMKRATGVAPIKAMGTDLNRLLYKLDLGVPPNMNAGHWGVTSMQKLLDAFPEALPYLRNTKYYLYLSELAQLMNDVISRNKQSLVLKILREFKSHRDFVVVSQFSTNEMVEYYKYLVDAVSVSNRYEVIRMLSIYESLCGIYEKDMILIYCFLRLIEDRFLQTYGEIRKETEDLTKKRHYIDHVGDRISNFRVPYKPELRNAPAHSDIQTDDQTKYVTVLGGKGRPSLEYSYDEIRLITLEMSSLVSACRLMIVVLAKNDWEWIEDKLYRY
jgi:hypothetical protein